MEGKELIFRYVFADFAVPTLLIKLFVYKKSQMPIIKTNFQYKITICDLCVLFVVNSQGYFRHTQKYFENTIMHNIFQVFFINLNINIFRLISITYHLFFPRKKLNDK